MMVSLHKNARTTPLIRAEIATSTDSAHVLAQRYGISEGSVYKWKHRTTTTDRSHTAHRLQTHLTPAQEAIVVYLRRALLLPLDDLLAVIREFLCPDVSRSGLDRCLRRHGVGNLNELKPKTPQEAPKSYKAYERATCTSISNTYRKWPMRPGAAISSLPSTGRPAGSMWHSSPTRPLPAPNAFSRPCTQPVRSRSLAS